MVGCDGSPLPDRPTVLGAKVRGCPPASFPQEVHEMSVSSAKVRCSMFIVLAAIVMGPVSQAWAGDDKEKGDAIPTCDKKIGTMAVNEPENQWWVQYNLESPEALIKVFAQESKCFTLLDRGKGL